MTKAQAYLSYGGMEFPVYKSIDENCMLIGISHVDFPAKLPRELKRRVKIFASVIGDLDHVCMEGTSSWNSLREKGGIKDYETFAVEFAKSTDKPLYFLEDDECLGNRQTYAGILQQKGISIHQGIAFDTLQRFKDIVLSSKGRLSESLMEFIDSLTVVMPSLGNHNRDKVMNILGILICYSAEKKGGDYDLFKFEEDRTWSKYFSRLRDHSFFIPRIALAREQLEGKIGVVIGARHIDPIIEGLSGKILSVPTWQEYVASLPEEQQWIPKTLYAIEKEMERQKRAKT